MAISKCMPNLSVIDMSLGSNTSLLTFSFAKKKKKREVEILLFKVEKILKGSLNLIPSPLSLVKIQITGAKVLKQKVC